MYGLIKRLAEQAYRRPDRIGGVNEDDVEFTRMLLHVTNAVDHLYVDARIRQASGDLRKIRLGCLDDTAIDFGKHRPLDRWMLDDLANNAAVTPAHDQYAFRIRVRVQGYVRQHLVVDELVFIGRHHATVEYQKIAILCRLVDVELLKFGALAVNRLFYPQTNRKIFVLKLCKP